MKAPLKTRTRRKKKCPENRNVDHGPEPFRPQRPVPTRAEMRSVTAPLKSPIFWFALETHLLSTWSESFGSAGGLCGVDQNSKNPTRPSPRRRPGSRILWGGPKMKTLDSGLRRNDGRSYPMRSRSIQLQAYGGLKQATCFARGCLPPCSPRSSYPSSRSSRCHFSTPRNHK